MDISRYRDELNAVIPGVVTAYESLKTTNGMGIFTSNGAFYNHTFFARDTAMAAKFVTDFDHQTARETIIALAALQGTDTDPLTQEEPGRIHHEFRDFDTWKGSGVERLVLAFFKRRWGTKGSQMLTYYATDTTALYLRLVHKYITHVDKSFLDVTIKNRNEETLTLRESVALAADWLAKTIDDRGHSVTSRPNKWALPYQTFMDSSTAYPKKDGSLTNYKKAHTFVEIQAFVIDALEDATHILSNHPHRHDWQNAAHTLRRALVKDFWSETENYFGSVVDDSGLNDMPTVTAGWTLNTSLWDELPDSEERAIISSVVSRLFSEDFLTPVGLRTRALHTDQPLPGLIEYHGRLTVWPMFSFMVIEGLRRHRLHRLAAELENRVVNGINISSNFEEFLVVDGGGHLLRSVPGEQAEVSVDAQMKPERNIAFTVIPAMVLAWRAINPGRAWPKQEPWQKELEEEIIRNIDQTERLIPEQAIGVVSAIVPTKFRRIRGNIRSAWYFLNERRRM